MGFPVPTDDIDAAFWKFLDELRDWQWTQFKAVWRSVNARSFDQSYGVVYPRLVKLGATSVQTALFAADDYVTLMAAESGFWVSPDWRESLWITRPWEVQSSRYPLADALFFPPSAMKRQIGLGNGPQAALDRGASRASRAIIGEAHSAARDYLADFVAVDGGPPVRPDLTKPEAAARAERVLTPGGGSQGVKIPWTEESRARARMVQQLLAENPKVPPRTIGSLVGDTITADPRTPARWDRSLPAVGGNEGVFQAWRRVPLPGACDFCIILATRGAVYGSKKRALLRKDGSRYHSHCRCRSQLVTDSSQHNVGIIDPDDAKRTVQYRAKTGKTYVYDLSDPAVLAAKGFRLRPPSPSWL